MDNICYIGIDIGDKTISVNEVKGGVSNSITDVHLPGQKANEPIQSAVGYLKSGGKVLAHRFHDVVPEHFLKISSNFKRCPTSLTKIGENEIESLFGGVSRIWPRHTGLNTPEMLMFRDGVKDLLDIVLKSDVTGGALAGLAQSAGEIVFCIGYPTNWNECDRMIYERIVRLGILGRYEECESFGGKPMRLVFERESTAAFVYMKLFSNRLYKTGKSDKLLLLDFGSSTVNVTAMTTDSRTTLYNSGHNFFGGRLLDCVIVEYFLEQISAGEREMVEMLDSSNNGVASKLLILAAGEAKENLSEAGQSAARIAFLDIKKTVKLTREILDMLLNRPIAPIVRKYRLIPSGECDKFGGMSWKEVLQSYLRKERAALSQREIIPDTVILTGGGALLYAVQDICRDVFGEIQMLDARESTKTISKGLALAAKQADRSAQFDSDVREFIDKRLTKVIEMEVPSLAKPMSADIAAYMCDELIIPELIGWREGLCPTLDAAAGRIKDKCTADGFEEKLKNSRAIKDTVKNWSINILGGAIAGELEKICIKYSVKNFKVGDLNVINVPSINVSGTAAIPAAEMDFLANILAGITGIVAAIIAPGLLVLILEIIAVIMPGLAAMIAGIILAIPGGIVIIAGIAGIAAVKLVRHGWQSVRGDIIRGISETNIPEFARKAVSESKIRSSVIEGKSEIEKKIYDNMTSSDNVRNIARQTGTTLAGQIDAKMDEIRYILETTQ